MLFTWLGSTATAADGEPWGDHAHGLTATLPANVGRVIDPLDDAVLRIISPNGEDDYRISIEVKRNDRRSGIRKIVKTAMQGASFTAVDPELLGKQRFMKIEQRDAALVYYRHGDRYRKPWERVTGKAKPQPWMSGHAFVLMPPSETDNRAHLPSDRLLVMTLDVDAAQYERGRAAFESMLRSLRMQSPKAIALRRMERISASELWQSDMKFQDWLDACIPLQLFRIRQSDRDIGYMRIRQMPGEEMQLKGLRVVIESRVYWQDRIVDTLGKYFLSEDDMTEFWSSLVTERRRQHKKGERESVSWAETGLRSANQISVVRDGPTGKKTYNWAKPTQAYLPQAKLHLLGQMLKGAPADELGFYTFYASTDSLAFRTEQIKPQTDGSYQILSRPNPQKPLFRSVYNTTGSMISQQLPDDTNLLAATEKDLAVRWKMK